MYSAVSLSLKCYWVDEVRLRRNNSGTKIKSFKVWPIQKTQHTPHVTSVPTSDWKYWTMLSCLQHGSSHYFLRRCYIWQLCSEQLFCIWDSVVKQENIISCHQLQLAPWCFRAAWEMEGFTAECCTTVVQQKNLECFGHLHIGYGSDPKITPGAMVMPPPTNQNSEIHNTLSYKKWSLTLKGRMQLHVTAFTCRQNIWKCLDDLIKSSKSADLIPETGITTSLWCLFGFFKSRRYIF